MDPCTFCSSRGMSWKSLSFTLWWCIEPSNVYPGPCASCQSEVAFVSPQVFVPVAGSWSFVLLLLLLCTTRRPTCRRASDRLVTSIPQHAAVHMIGHTSAHEFVIRKSGRNICFFVCLKSGDVLHFGRNFKQDIYLVFMLLSVFSKFNQKETIQTLQNIYFPLLVTHLSPDIRSIF